ncbi:T9SS type A sorting domain-containing protein [Patiriisocius marinus]|uniref:Secretion system C-terminal sorting domain-containing protein n=1 Tax=Patiriisocius marinus TaxID=1397112 RepID=A0A5J4J650_9FLAO|nr:T9SS type A sorting domain-containing protein [Patiriisocius marinus]GER59957.1 hypothetical protein ULMA_20650 [Patiriisocius marinus]
MKKYYTLIALSFFFSSFSQNIIELRHNIGDQIIDQASNASCSFGGVNWGRVYNLEDFGITEDFNINQIKYGIQESSSAPDNGMFLRVYAIDENFPDSFPTSTLLGESEIIDMPSFVNRQIFTYTFTSPVVVPASVDRILIELFQQNSNQTVFMGGTAMSNDFSWFRDLGGCLTTTYQTTVDLNRPNVNYYIVAEGEISTLGSNENNSKSLVLSPNPVTEILKLQGDTLNQNDIISIYNIQGKLLRTEDYKEVINVDNLQAGIYFLHIENESRKYIKRFIKN